MTKKGIKEAKTAARLLQKESFYFDLIYSSVLKRANKTTTICLNDMGLSNITIKNDWRLNERHYGALQGLSKSETAKKIWK